MYVQVLWKPWSTRKVAGLIIIIIIISIAKLQRALQKGNIIWFRGIGRKEGSKNSLFWGSWVLCMAFFPKKKKKEKNLKQSKHTKRKNQRIALLQVIIYYKNSAATQLFWLQPWWAERGRKAAKRGTFYALLTEEPRTKRLWEMVYLVLISEFSVTTWSTNCLKLISLSNHFPLQSSLPFCS